ncbi:MAG TPA: serine/threonine-protein kinase PknK [Chthoniobacterales bacterium]|nr:serine/threonine-protein kinase PknK [Chthoniobacterales bacterium]
MVELATYRLESLRRDAEIVLSRGRRETSPCQILVVAPRSKRPSPETLKRLGREYSLRAELDSAFAVRPLALIREGEQTALILEDRGGKPLDRLLGQALDLTEFLRISINLANALGRLHERGIIHRDIKPANVIVDTASSRVWLTGFGIASDLPRQRQTPERPETIAGTLPYMSPEQTGRMNRSIDSRSDLYSLGVTLYEMLTGALPFSASDPLEWVHCHIARQPIPPGERAKNLPASVCAIIMKLLAKTAEERYQTAAGAESDLRRCLAQWETQRRIDNFPLGEHDTPDRLLIPEKLYGRGREIDTLLASFDRVVASGTPELVLVSGYSGIGKSSVVNELHKALVPSRGLFASGKFDQYKRDIPYSILAQAFQSLVRPLLGKSEAELHNWRDALLEALGANGLLMVDLVPELELIIGEQPAVPELPPQDAKARFQLVFRRFIGVFARREHPLALFLDDLQWLDAATLDLLEDLLSQPDVRHLMLIGAYRDNEVSAGHPLMRKLEAIRQTGAIVEEVILAPLTRGDLRQLIADALHCELERASSLAQVVHEKTAGNPFFAIQFISALTEEALLTFDHGDRRWSWDPNRIHDKGYTDNAVDLMVGKLSRLPPQTQKALQQLACFGNSSEITTLSIVNGKSEEELHSDLREAVRLEFIVRLEDSYRFVHDRVQEAAYSLISEERRAEAHLRIARLLTADIPPEDLIETIFEIVNQYNRGAALILDPNEKLRVAELNFLAGRKAKTQTAYAAACDYLSIGATLLDPKEWQSQYEFVFEVSLLCAECAFLCGRFDKAAGLTSYLLERASSKADKAAVYRLKTDLYIMKSAYPEAVDSALECLRLFGIYLSAHPSSEEVEREYKNVWRNLGERSIESLVDLPLMADREIQAAMRVLSVLYSPAFFVDTKLFYLSICHIVNLTLKYGVADASAHGYAYFGFILGPAFNRYAEGYRFGQLSVNLVEKHGFVPYKAKVYMTMAWVAIWTQPIATALGFIRNALSAAVELGDLTYGCYACDHTITDLLVRGDQLDEVWGESQRCLDFVQKAKSPDYVDRIITQQQFIQNMRGSTNNFSTFSNSLFDEADFEAKLPGDRAITCWYWILKLQARFISRDYEVAIAAAVNAERLLWAATGCIQLSEYHYYAALTMAALYTASAPDRQNEWREKLTAHRDQLKEWAENCSITFQDKYALVSAEIARIEGRAVDAEHLYEKAIRSAHANRFVHSEALANELAARFYAARGFEKIAHAYLRDARYCYVCWGATGKVR